MAGYPQFELDRQLCFALYTASRAVARAYAPLLADASLTYPQYVTMLALWENPDQSRSVGELGERLHLYHAVGMVLIFAGVWLAAQRRR